MMNGIKTYGSEELIEKLPYMEAVFMCVIGTTETSLIPGISGAGSTPEMTEYTPAADAELMVYGDVKCMDGTAKTVVNGLTAHTPATITKACIELTDIPFVIVNAGSKINPNIECNVLGHEYGRDIRTGKGVINPLEIYENGKELGLRLNGLHDYLVIGESIAAGTTTALGVLKALGIDANKKVSGSMPTNPHDLKIKTVEEGLKNAGLDKEDDIDVFQAIGCVGDPILPAIAGIIIGTPETPIILAGGTQMAAVCAIIKNINPNFDFSRINIATTIYVAEDETADLINLLKQIDSEITLHVVDPKFEKSEDDGLKLYAEGYVKEGAGAGGAILTALTKGHSQETIIKKIEKLCKN